LYDYDECETKGVSEKEMIDYFKKEIVKEIELLKSQQQM
jgi:hypothetical protein